MAILEVSHIEKHFGKTNVLKDVSFSMEEGTALAIIGSSGSGKTTLLRCLNFLERPNSGTITVNGETLFDAASAGAEKDAELRKKRLHFGMVFQSFNLFPQYTALQNVTLAEQLLAQERPDFKADKKKILEEIDAHGRQLLERMGLAERMDHYPHQLSGGQQQRVAIARALALIKTLNCNGIDRITDRCTDRSGTIKAAACIIDWCTVVIGDWLVFVSGSQCHSLLIKGRSIGGYDLKCRTWLTGTVCSTVQGKAGSLGSTSANDRLHISGMLVDNRHC